MKKRIAKYILAGSALLMSSQLAFSQFTMTGEIRPRAEFRNGFKRPTAENVDPAFFVEQRSRLYFNYVRDKIEVNMAFQDIRIWGSVDQIYKQDPNLTNFHEAWGKYNFTDKWAMKVGRQAISYDTERFLGGLDWAAQGRSHDAFLIVMENDPKKIKLHVGGAYNQNWFFEPGKLEGHYYDHELTNNYKTMAYAWFNKKWEKGQLSLLVHNDGRQLATDSSIVNMQTLGFAGDKKLGDHTIGGEAYYQMGENGGGAEVAAYMASLYFTYKTDLTPITIGGDYMSGTSLTDEDYTSFAPLYGTNHKFYGYMDYFYVGNYHGQQAGATSGLIDLYLKTKFKLGEKSSLVGHLHYFMSPVDIYEDVVTPEATMSSGLGTEVDLVYVWNMDKDVWMKFGYSQMFATESMVAIKGGVGEHDITNNWAWVMLSIKPTLFTTAK